MYELALPSKRQRAVARRGYVWILPPNRHTLSLNTQSRAQQTHKVAGRDPCELTHAAWTPQRHAPRRPSRAPLVGRPPPTGRAPQPPPARPSTAPPPRGATFEASRVFAVVSSSNAPRIAGHRAVAKSLFSLYVWFRVITPPGLQGGDVCRLQGADVRRKLWQGLSRSLASVSATLRAAPSHRSAGHTACRRAQHKPDTSTQ
eukprot:scaffold1105_cov54-Phaeocystis_antarctica.AAC.3